MTVADLIQLNKYEDGYLAPDLQECAEMEEAAKKEDYKYTIVWQNVGIQLALHIGGLIGLWMSFTSAMWQTNVYMLIMVIYASVCITGGAHRMWTHRAFKANFWVRVFLMLGCTMAAQNDVIEWARDHRAHHKWSDTDADPHNVRRGFFFSHVGWLMVRKHPKVKEMGGKIDLSDLTSDPVLRFQRRYYLILVPLITFLFNTIVPMKLWGENPIVSFYVASILRLVIQLNGTWLINSASHMYGYQPFDTRITAVDNYTLAVFTMGEAWHNYHHTFPQDYRVSEYPYKGNLTNLMIDFFAWNGWVWDRKMMSDEAIQRQKNKLGDHSRDEEDQIRKEMMTLKKEIDKAAKVQ